MFQVRHTIFLDRPNVDSLASKDGDPPHAFPKQQQQRKRERENHMLDISFKREP